MSNSDCGDRGLATRRGVCVCARVRVSCGMIVTYYCTALHARPLPKPSPVARPRRWQRSARSHTTPSSALHRDVALQWMQRPELVIREQWRVRPAPWTGLSTTAAGLLPSLERLQLSTASGVLALVTGLWAVPGSNPNQHDAVSLPARGCEMRLSRMTRPLAQADKSITCWIFDDLGRSAHGVTDI